MALIAEDFFDLMRPVAPFEKGALLAVAVSGGSDSMALALLAKDYADAEGLSCKAFIVDHGLRSESAQEAQTVQARLNAQGIAADILTWQPDKKPVSDIQGRARDARYALLTAACREEKAAALLVAHHQEDQAETFLLRLARGSGVDGLSAMQVEAERDGVRILRPLLSVPKAQLSALCAEKGVVVVDDPSNEKDAFARVRIRRLLPLLAEEGITAERLFKTASTMQRAKAALDEQVQAIFKTQARGSAAGALELPRALFATQPEEIALRLLKSCLLHVGGGSFPPRLSRLLSLYRTLVAEKSSPVDKTFCGCRIQAAESVLFFREKEAASPPLTLDAAGTYLWDGRFRVTMGRGSFPVTVEVPRAVDLTALKKAGLFEKSPVPRKVIETCPAFYRGDVLLGVPHLSYWLEAEACPVEQIFFEPAFPALAPMGLSL